MGRMSRAGVYMYSGSSGMVVKGKRRLEDKITSHMAAMMRKRYRMNVQDEKRMAEKMHGRTSRGKEEYEWPKNNQHAHPPS
jgi:hypothetical protein